ncbi:unnamed protein product [Rhizoctonia solani]|uniref:HMG box domain-containing protein n=1 Tax=Rhizoctonia solani TaxID=456999 RepID=A0A8H3GI14_9AGAM|nr:unnamed protein product [Rhizoctonia solani]
MAHPQMHRTKPPPMDVGHVANQINAMPVAPAAESQKREIVAKLNDLAAQMKGWAAQVEGFASHLNTLSVQPSPPEVQYSSRAPTNGQYNAYIQQYGSSSQYQFQTSHQQQQQQYSQAGRLSEADYAELSKVSPVPLGPGSAIPTPDESEKTGKRRRRTDSTRKKKDPLAPKRPPSAYILYQNDVRKQMQDKYIGLPYSDVLGKISESWQTLEESKKKVYLDMVERDKLRYEDEKSRYNAGQDIPTRPTPRRPLSSLRAPSDPGPDADAEVEPEPEGDEEEDLEEEREEQMQPDAKRSKLGSTHEVQPERPIGQTPEPRSQSQPSEASDQPGYPQSQRTSQTPASGVPQQPHQVILPQPAAQAPYPQHVTVAQHASYTNPISSLHSQPSPQAGHVALQATCTTPTPTRPQGVHSSPQLAHANPPAMHASPPRHPHPSPQAIQVSPQIINAIPHITHSSPLQVHAPPQKAHLQPQPQPQNPNPISMMQMPHLTQVPPSGPSTQVVEILNAVDERK